MLVSVVAVGVTEVNWNFEQTMPAYRLFPWDSFWGQYVEMLIISSFPGATIFRVQQRSRRAEKIRIKGISLYETQCILLTLYLLLDRIHLNGAHRSRPTDPALET